MPRSRLRSYRLSAPHRSSPTLVPNARACSSPPSTCRCYSYPPTTASQPQKVSRPGAKPRSRPSCCSPTSYSTPTCPLFQRPHYRGATPSSRPTSYRPVALLPPALRPALCQLPGSHGPGARPRAPAAEMYSHFLVPTFRCTQPPTQRPSGWPRRQHKTMLQGASAGSCSLEYCR